MTKLTDGTSHFVAECDYCGKRLKKCDSRYDAAQAKIVAGWHHIPSKSNFFKDCCPECWMLGAHEEKSDA